MLKNSKSKQKLSVKNKSKPSSVKKRNSVLDKEISSKSTKQSSPSSNTPTNKNKSKIVHDKGSKANSIDSSMDSSLNSSQIVKETCNMKEKIQDSLKVFKNVNKEYISQNLVLLNEVDTFEENFTNVKNEISEILIESSRSKEELSRMKMIIETPKSRIPESEILELDLSSVKVPKDEMIYQTLKHLQDEVNMMREIIEHNEKEIREKDSENNELRSVAYKIRDSLTTETLTIETEENRPACTGCYLF